MSVSTGPRCPNHLVQLNDCKRTGRGKGVGICPVSMYRFEYNADDLEKDRKQQHDKFGNIVKKDEYKVTQLDGTGG